MAKGGGSSVDGMKGDVRLLALALQTPGAGNPLLVGGPGEAKTDCIMQIAERLNLGHVEPILAATRDPVDFGGVMVPDPDPEIGLRLECMPWMRRLVKAKRGVLFLDEINSASPAVQAALQTGVLSRRFGDTVLPESISIVAAMNPTAQATGGWDLPDPMANRWVWLPWRGPNLDEWFEYLHNGKGANLDVPRLSLEEFARKLPIAKSQVSGFHRRMPGKLREAATAYEGRKLKAFATPRSWESATRLLATCLATREEAAILPLVAGAIGDPIAIEFAAWRREANLPDPEELLVEAIATGKTSWAPDPKRQDLTYATLLSVSHAATQEREDKKEFEKRWEAAWVVLGAGMAGGKDTVALAVRTLAQKRPPGQMFKKDVLKVAQELLAVTKEAGIFNPNERG